jgi:hypothetical protein
MLPSWQNPRNVTTGNNRPKADLGCRAVLYLSQAPRLSRNRIESKADGRLAIGNFEAKRFVMVSMRREKRRRVSLGRGSEGPLRVTKADTPQVSPTASSSICPTRKWDARHHAGSGRATQSNWVLALLLVATMLVGCTALIATIARLFDLLHTGGAYG